MTAFPTNEGHLVYAAELEQRIAAVLPEILKYKARIDGTLQSFERDDLLQVLLGGMPSLPEERIPEFPRALLRKALRIAKVDSWVTNIILGMGLQGLAEPFIVSHCGYVVTQKYYREGKRRQKALERSRAELAEATE